MPNYNFDYSVFKKCNFEKITHETAFQQVVEPILNDGLEDFKIQSRKIVLVFLNFDLVFKIPIANRFEKTKIVPVYQTESANKIFQTQLDIYEQAHNEFQENNFFLPYSPCKEILSPITIYTQPRVRVMDNELTMELLSKFSYQNISKMLDMNLILKMNQFNYDKRTLIWLQEIQRQTLIAPIYIINFLKEKKIFDIHGGNLGLMVNNNKPVIFDYEF